MNKIRPIVFIQENIPHDASVLDIGAGDGKYSKPFSRAITLDAYDKVTPDILIDLSNHPLPFEESSIDYILAMDFIEHLEKSRGITLLQEMMTIVKKRIYLLTPLWWQTNEKITKDKKSYQFENRFNLHKSLWTIEDFTSLGWINLGWKNKSGEYFFGYWDKI